MKGPSRAVSCFLIWVIEFGKFFRQYIHDMCVFLYNYTLIKAFTFYLFLFSLQPKSEIARDLFSIYQFYEVPKYLRLYEFAMYC